MTGDSPVHFGDGTSPKMHAAYRAAVETFPMFWREMSWEQRRIIPAFEIAVVKVAISDANVGQRACSDDEDVEQMWLRDIQFDGKSIRGALMGTPNWLRTVNGGDPVTVPLEDISDWMLASPRLAKGVTGGHTVQVLRSEMSMAERHQHDGMWGLEFPPLGTIYTVFEREEPKAPGFFGKLFKSKKEPLPTLRATLPDDPHTDHPMAVATVEDQRAYFRANRQHITPPENGGQTMLHFEALGGNRLQVQMLLDLGADKHAVDDNGFTPYQLAERMGWSRVMDVLA